jgi:AcrR family transcriptional regulator
MTPPARGRAAKATGRTAAASRLPSGTGYSGTALRVLESATELFADKGFHGTSMRDIASAVGVRAASLYEHFPSKDQILATVLTIGHEAVRDQLQAAVDAAGDDPVAQLDAAVRTLVTQLCRSPQLAMAVNSELRALAPELAARPTRARDEVSVILAAILHRGMQSGAFRERNIALLVAAIGSMCIRTPYWFESSAVYSVDDLARDYAELAVGMVRAQP